MNADTLIVEGRAYSWRHLCELRRAQVEAQNRARARQLALFAMVEDHRPASQGDAAGRYLEPTLFDAAAQYSE
jgi:uncharacterized heparinase superfamily protein